MKNLKRVLSLALSTVMLMGMMVMGTSAADYKDVDSADNVEAIEVLKAVGVMEGDEKGNFNPDQKVTRNEMAVVMANLLGLRVQDYANATLTFKDVPAWATPYVAACYANGIISGYSATEFGGEDSITTAQAGLMMMKALGYFQFQPDFGDDWQMSTTLQASKLYLYENIDTAVTAPLTRNDVAQLALNTLLTPVVEYSGDQGTNIKTTDGTEILIGYTIKYEAMDDISSIDYSTNTTDGDDTKELCEQLYGNDLQLTLGTDDFENVSNNWSFDGVAVGKFATEADKIYTTAVKEKTLYADLGLNSSNNTGWTIVVDGYTVNNANKTIGKTVTTNITDTFYGAQTSVYTDAKKIVIVNTYVDEVAYVTEKNANDKREVTLSNGAKFETEAFAEDDIVIYTFLDGNHDDIVNAGEAVKSMALVEKKTGKLTKMVGTNDYYIDGTKICGSAKAVVDAAVNVGDEVDYYVDSYGYIIKMTEAEAVVDVNNMALVLRTGNDRGQDWAKLLFADGTTKVVDLAKALTADIDPTAGTTAVAANQIVSYKVQDNGTYKLTLLTKTVEINNSVPGTQIDLLSGKPNIGPDANNDGVLDSNTVLTDNKTVFVYGIVGSNGTDYKVYNGYKNAPSFDSINATVAAYSKANSDPTLVVEYTNTKVADIVFITGVLSGEMGANSTDLTVVGFDKDIKMIDLGDSVTYYEYAAVVDGEITSIKVDDTEWATLYAASSSKTSIYKKATIDSDGISTFSAGDLVGTPVTEVKYSNETVVLGTTTFAYDDDVKVFVIDTDGQITGLDVTKIREDNGSTKNPYAHITYTTDSNTGAVTLIVLQLNP